jgi:two-component system NtrC family sensor kinase
MTPDPHRRILIVDDNRAIHDDFRKILCPDKSAIDDATAEFFGDPLKTVKKPVFEVEFASQGEEAVSMVRQALAEGRPYAMAFIDVRMPPGIDGIETTEWVWEICPDLQVVICSAYSDYSWEQMLFRVGNSDRLLVLKKPFAPIEALQFACALTEKWRLTQQAQRKLEVSQRIGMERKQELAHANERLVSEVKQRRDVESQLLRVQRMESINTMASGIAHDLNNTLAPIRMCVPLLRDELTDETRDIIISTIETCSERASSVLRQVLTFARGVDGERLNLQPSDLMDEITLMCTKTFPQNVSFNYVPNDDLWAVKGDPTQLHQVLMNLCVNARDAMPDGGILSLHAENTEVDDNYASMIPGLKPGRYVKITVRDNGSGIPMECIEKIFDPFFTTKPVGKGTGLGLSSALGIVRSHNGFLEVRSEVGQGTTFEIFLPEQANSATRAIPVPVEPANGNGELILVVDDEPEIRAAAQRVLFKHGYRAITACDGAEALAIYAASVDPIHAVLTDIMMPVVDGVALCRALKKIDPGVRVIASTGGGERSRAAELETLNVRRILEKPFSTGALLSMLREALESSPIPSVSTHAVGIDY